MIRRIRNRRLRALFVLPALLAVIALGAGAVNERRHAERYAALKQTHREELAQMQLRANACAPVPPKCSEYLVMGEGWNLIHCSPAKPVRM